MNAQYGTMRIRWVRGEFSAVEFARKLQAFGYLAGPAGEKSADPLAMYLFDLCTLPLNLAGHCGMSVPSGLSPDDNLPVGLQIMAPALADDRLYRVGAAYEAARGALPSAL